MFTNLQIRGFDKNEFVEDASPGITKVRRIPLVIGMGSTLSSLLLLEGVLLQNGLKFKQTVIT